MVEQTDAEFIARIKAQIMKHNPHEKLLGVASAPPPESASGLSQAVRDVLVERQRQIAKGYDATHDDEHKRGQIIWDDWGAMYRLAQYAAPSTRMTLVEAAAQVIAEIERLDRLPASPASEQEGGG